LRISDDDLKGPQSDYLDASITAVTNELAVLTPYELTFRCFSTELAGVLAGFANSPHGFIIKTVNVETGGAAAGVGDQAAGGYPPGYPPGYYPGNRPEMMATPAPVAQTTLRGGVPVLLDEKQLKVTMIVTLVKLLPRK
jgi:hypothetical protein